VRAAAISACGAGRAADARGFAAIECSAAPLLSLTEARAGDVAIQEISPLFAEPADSAAASERRAARAQKKSSAERQAVHNGRLLKVAIALLLANLAVLSVILGSIVEARGAVDAAQARYAAPMAFAVRALTLLSDFTDSTSRLIGGSVPVLLNRLADSDFGLLGSRLANITSSAAAGSCSNVSAPGLECQNVRNATSWYYDLCCTLDDAAWTSTVYYCWVYNSTTGTNTYELCGSDYRAIWCGCARAC
jgi:hypothetical protein